MPTTTRTETDRLRADKARAAADQARAEADRLAAEVAAADQADRQAAQDRLDNHDRETFESYDRAAVDADVDAKYQALLDAIKADPIVSAWVAWSAARHDRYRTHEERRSFSTRWREAHPDDPLKSSPSGSIPPSTGVEIASLVATTASNEVNARAADLDDARTAARDAAYTGD